MKPPRLSPLSTALAIALVAPGLATAQHITEPVVVTASRNIEAVSETLAAVTVIDRKTIEASATGDLFDLLRRVPNLDIARSGGPGQQTALFLRGGNSNHALVLIDGVRVSALGSGAYAWEQLSLAQIERIEIVRGPRAALWGADALSGVIHIFTRREAGADAALTVGNHDSYGVDAGFGHEGERGRFGLRAGWFDTRGTNATTPTNWSFDPDRDGTTRRNISAFAQVPLGEQTLSANLLRNDNEVAFDIGESQTTQDVFGLALEGELASGWHHRLNLGGNRDRLDTPSSFTRYDSRREQADWQHTLDRAGLTFGLSWLDERAENLDTFGNVATYDEGRHNKSAFAAWRRSTGAHSLELSGRYDDNSVYGGHDSFAAAWGWRLSDALRLSASWGEGFRAPTMNELYSPGFGGWYAGNPNLDPETAENLELALRVATDGFGDITLRAFRNDVDGLIDFSGGDTMYAINIQQARVEGVELEWQRRMGAWRIDASASWQDARNRATDEKLLRRAPRKASLIVEREFDGGARVGVEGYAAAARPDLGVELPGYGLVALRANWPLGAGFRLDARLENLLDREYRLVDACTTPGFTATLALRWQRP